MIGQEPPSTLESELRAAQLVDSLKEAQQTINQLSQELDEVKSERSSFETRTNRQIEEMKSQNDRDRLDHSNEVSS